MNIALDNTDQTFVQVAEVWALEGDKLVLVGGDYGSLAEFAAASGQETFALGEGLPGKAWANAAPIVLKEFEGSYFKRTKAAKAAGLTCGVAIPIFAEDALKAVLVILCGDDGNRMGAIEVWHEQNDLMVLDDGYYGAAKHFEWISRRTQFPPGQGLPGSVWASMTPMLLHDLGASYRFVRADAAHKAGITSGVGFPVPVPGGQPFVLTLLSARGTPLARRFEVWDAREATDPADAVLIDEHSWAAEGEEPRRAAARSAAVATVLGSGVPVVGGRHLAGNYDTVVALPIHSGAKVAFVVAWYR